MRPHVLVVGSLNIDYIASVDRLPAPGETILASGLIQRFGGKGANQAVAAARQGVAVSMIGCVGNDDSGRAYRKRLEAEGINPRFISSTVEALTGTALIAVDKSAENLIIVAPGANAKLKPVTVTKQIQSARNSAALLLQFEVPPATVQESITTANRLGIPVILNPSPWRSGFPWAKCKIDTLIVNEHEAAAIFDGPRNKTQWASQLEKKNIARLVVTRGASATVCVENRRLFEVPGIKVKPVDTVGAGDAFAGTFAARIAEGADFRTAVAFANCAGALATLKPGAQESIPSRTQTQRTFAKAGLRLWS